jgi:RNase H-like domain found in reverse transcriptase
MFSDTETCYNGIEKKFLGIIYALESFRPGIQLIELIIWVLTDHCNLTFLVKFELKLERHFKWHDLICNYHLESNYVKGTLNEVAYGFLQLILEEKKEAKVIVNFTEPQVIS